MGRLRGRWSQLVAPLEERKKRSTRVVPCGLREGSQPGRARHGVKPTTESRQREVAPWDLRADHKGLFVFCSDRRGRDPPEHLLRDFAILRSEDVLPLGKAVGREHLVAQLAQTGAGAAVPGAAPRHLGRAAGELECRSSHGSDVSVRESCLRCRPRHKAGSGPIRLARISPFCLS